MRNLTYILAIVITFGFLGSGAHAQNKEAWLLSCADKNKAETCRMSQSQQASKMVDGKPQMLGRLLAVTVLYVLEPKSKKRVPNMTIQLPMGVDLRAGTVIQIDKNKEFTLPYLRCTNMGCDVSMKLTKKLIRSILSGNQLRVGFRAWGSNKTNVVTASLSGFTKIFRRLK